MIKSLKNVQSSNVSGVKTVTVFAVSDATGGPDTVNFQIGAQLVSVPVNLAANGDQTVPAVHTSSGTVLIDVSAAGGGAPAISKMLNVDLAQDSGLGAATAGGPI
jgi:hypothetical protein